MGETPRCRITLTIKALCLAAVCITTAEGALTEDLTKDIMAFPGFSDLPLCGSCRVAHITGYCAGKDHLVSLTGCKTASLSVRPVEGADYHQLHLKGGGLRLWDQGYGDTRCGCQCVQGVLREST